MELWILEDSLRRRLEEAGFQVSCGMRGLGELPVIRERLVRRAKSALETIH